MTYDSKATKERILAAAVAEFAARGVAGTRVDRIASEARANKRAIYDYFGDKETLFGVVLERELTDCAEAVFMDGSDLADYARRLYEYQCAHPEVLRLLMWEALEFPGDKVPGFEARSAKYEARAARIAAAGHDPHKARELLFFIMALVNWGMVAPQLRTMVLGEGKDMGDLAEAIAEAVRTLAKPEA